MENHMREFRETDGSALGQKVAALERRLAELEKKPNLVGRGDIKVEGNVIGGGGGDLEGDTEQLLLITNGVYRVRNFIVE